MVGLAERLDALARESTAAVELLPHELAVRARRRHRIRALGGSLAVAACAVAGSLYAITSSAGSSKVVRVATPPSVTSATTPAPSSAGVWVELAAIARQQAAQFGDPSPGSAEAVATDIVSFEQATGTEGSSSMSFNRKVYFLLVTGHFTCGPSCYNVSANTPTGTVLSLAVDQATLAITATALSSQPVELSRLGQVHRLDLSAGSPVTGPLPPSSTAPVTVPNIAGMTQAAAVEVLRAADLLNNVTAQPSNVVPAGVVISEAPSPGSRVEPGSTITVTVSSGPPRPTGPAAG